MSFLYSTGIAAYTFLIRVASLFNSKAREWVDGRHGWRDKLAASFEAGEKVAWFHAASLGEFEQGRPVIEAFREQYPGYSILLTFFSPSGYRLRHDYEGADVVMYLPADHRRNAKYFVKTLKPAIAIFIKYEFWFNYLSELKKAGIPVIFISAIFRRSQPFFRWYGSWFRGRLKSIDHFFVQDKHSAELLESTGTGNSTVSGDTRFDRVADILQKKEGDPGIERFCEGNKVLLAGSTWPPDEAILSNIPQRFPDIKLIIAPHEVKEERITQLMKTMNAEVARFTKDDPADWPAMQVLIIDTIGILSSVYRYADIAYIGGAFSTGLHNIQEPAVNGMPVIFGPKYQKFREAVELVELGGAFYVRNNEELQSILIKLLGDEGMFLTACETSRKYMQEQRGATRKIMEGLAQYLD